jgi:molybdopterin converting factor small subunit
MTRSVEKSSVIRVKIGTVSVLREIMGRSLTLYLNSGNTIGDLIKRLDDEYGPAYTKQTGESLKDSVMKRYNIIVNGKIIRPAENSDRPLNENDELIFLQWAGGG